MTESDTRHKIKFRTVAVWVTDWKLDTDSFK